MLEKEIGMGVVVWTAGSVHLCNYRERVSIKFQDEEYGRHAKKRMLMEECTKLTASEIREVLRVELVKPILCFMWSNCAYFTPIAEKTPR
jgi:hypothetical protein